MAFTFDLAALANAAGSLASAFVLGALIGAERQYRQRTAGLRTNVLVAVGAATFVELGGRISAHDIAARHRSYRVLGPDRSGGVGEDVP